MLKIVELPSELPLETKIAPNLAPGDAQKASRVEKRAAIDAALAADPDRTDAEIAREIGCDAKTVKSRRGNSSPGNSDGKSGISNSQLGNSDGANSQLDGSNSQARPASEAQAPKTNIRDDAYDFDWNNPADDTLAEQRAVAVYRNRGGDLVIRQQNWPDDDSFIVIAQHCEAEFIDKLTDACGVPTAGG